MIVKQVINPFDPTGSNKVYIILFALLAIGLIVISLTNDQYDLLQHNNY